MRDKKIEDCIDGKVYGQDAMASLEEGWVRILDINQAIVAFVFAVLTANTIEKEAAVVGTLRALGYTRLETIGHYLRPTMKSLDK